MRTRWVPSGRICRAPTASSRATPPGRPPRSSPPSTRTRPRSGSRWAATRPTRSPPALTPREPNSWNGRRSPGTWTSELDELQALVLEPGKHILERCHGLRPVAAAVVAEQDVAGLGAQHVALDVVDAGPRPVARVDIPVDRIEAVVGDGLEDLR